MDHVSHVSVTANAMRAKQCLRGHLGDFFSGTLTCESGRIAYVTMEGNKDLLMALADLIYSQRQAHRIIASALPSF